MSLRLEALEDRLAPAVTVRFDYSLDTNNFFDTQQKRAVLQAAADQITSRFGDTLAPVRASDGNTFSTTYTDPSTGSPTRFTDPVLAADEILVYVGARPLGGSNTGIAAGVGVSARGSQEFLDLVFGRGQAGTLADPPTDFSPIGGSITFNINNNWYFGTSPAGLGSNQADFFSIAQHELIHLLGFAQSGSFDSHVSGGSFVGPTAVSVFGAPVPLELDEGHYVHQTRSFGALAIMNGAQLTGTRNPVTALDLAVLRDIGWEFELPSLTRTSLEIGPLSGQSRTLTARVSSPDGGTPTGTVTFVADRRPIGVVNLSDGVARLTTSASLPSGTRVEAIYSGDANFAASGSTFDGSLPPPVGVPPPPPPVTAPPSPPPPVSVPPPPPRPSGTPPTGQNTTGWFAIGTGPGGGIVTTFDAAGNVTGTYSPFTPSDAPGGSRVAMADVTGDGVADLIVAAGPGGIPAVRVYDGSNRELIRTFGAFESTFTGGVYVAAGDVTGNGVADIVVTPDEGGGPRVRIFDGASGSQLADFFGIDDPDFRGGARPALGDINGDGVSDLLVAAGFGGGPRLAVFNGASLRNTPTKLFDDFFLFEPALRNGAFVTAGDLNGDGFADVIAGGGPGGGPRVLALSGAALLRGDRIQLANFFAGDPETRGGVRVAAKNLDGDGRADLVTAAGSGSAPWVNVYFGTAIPPDGSAAPSGSFVAADPGFLGGIFVG